MYKVWEFTVIGQGENSNNVRSKVIKIYGTDRRLTLSDAASNAYYVMRDQSLFSDEETVNTSITSTSHYTANSEPEKSDWNEIKNQDIKTQTWSKRNVTHPECN